MIRFLEETEKLNISSLYESNFKNIRSVNEYFYDNILCESRVAVDIEDKDIISMLTLIDKDVSIVNKNEKCKYLFAAATKKDKRQMGHMSSLIKSVIKLLYDEGDSFTYLIPNDFSFIFEKYGFTFVYENAVGLKHDIRKRPTHSLILRSASRKDFERLAIFAQSVMEKRYGVFLTRDKEYFRKLYELMKAENGVIELFFEDKIILGYRVRIGNDIIEEVLDDSIEEMSILGEKKKPYAMARIINLKKVIDSIPVVGVGNVILKVKDNLVLANNGVYLWKYANGNYSFEETSMAPEMELDISELTAHLFGYKDIKGLPKVNLKRGFCINDYI